MRDWTRREVLGAGLGGVGAWLCSGAVRPVRGWVQEAAQAAAPERMVARAVEFLKGRQAADGSWSSDRKEPGITALVLTALLRSGRVSAHEPVITRGLQYLEPFLGEDGGLSGAAHANYTTAIAMLAYKEANVNGRYDARLKGAQEFLKGKQWDETEGKDSKDPYYGGAGYGGRNSRPDLSNTSFMIEALRETGLPADDPSLQKALIFISRCQNLQSEFNDQAWAGKVNDGGFIYTPAQGGVSMAGPTEEGGLRSYAGMTYAGLKSMIYAGLSREDARVKAALRYIANHYTVDENPGMGQAGLYYYYQVFAKALALLGEAKLRDAGGREHDWRADLRGALAARQREDGSWVNATDRFMEGDANLVTAYALLALDYAREKPQGARSG
jgi:squalene-hopene/tetraprenyl-beta-curcumene cyclase